MVYVMSSLSESFSSTTILFPALFISGVSSCGGDTTTLLAASSSLTNSSNVMVILRVFTPVALSAGEACTIFGGVSSYHPPSGCPIRAQEAVSNIAEMQATTILSMDKAARGLYFRCAPCPVLVSVVCVMLALSVISCCLFLLLYSCLEVLP